MDFNFSFMASNHLVELTPFMACENKLDPYQFLSQILTLVDKPHNHKK